MIDDRELEGRLHAALKAEADTVEPGDRLAAIRAAAGPRRRGGRWAALIPLVAAAAAAAVILLVWNGTRLPQRVAAPPSPAATSNTINATGLCGAVTVDVPVFSVAATSSTPTYGLIRETAHLNADPRDTAPTPATLATLALNAALHPGRLQASSACPQTLIGYIDPTRVQPWTTTTAARLVELASPEIGIELNEPGLDSDVTPEQAALAVQALVWTVTSVLQRPDAPVVVTVRSGGDIFPGLPGGVYKRPQDDRLGAELAPVWVDAPTSRDRLLAGTAVGVTGTACTLDGTVAWELRRGAATVTRGVATVGNASCPQVRGAWSVPLGILEAGDYELRIDENRTVSGGPAPIVVPFGVEEPFSASVPSR